MRGEPLSLARRVELGLDEYSPAWRGECCRACPWWTGAECRDAVNEYVHCAAYGRVFRVFHIDANGRCRECAAGRVAPRGAENREQKTERAAAKPQTFHGYRGARRATEERRGTGGGGVHLFDW